jgi:hypothetical protein
MPKFVAQQDEVKAWFPLTDMARKMPEINPRNGRGCVPRDGVIPLAPQRRISDDALLRGMSYQLHNGY